MPKEDAHDSDADTGIDSDAGPGFDTDVVRAMYVIPLHVLPPGKSHL